MAKEMIECSNCGKLIEKKVNRTMCIKCTNVWNKIQAEKRRATQEYKEYYKEYTKNHKRKGRTYGKLLINKRRF